MKTYSDILNTMNADLKNNGYVGYVCDAYGIFINLQSDNTFCFSSNLMGYKEVTLNELYSNVKVVDTYDAIKSQTKENLCSDVEHKIDMFTNEETYNSQDVDDISFIKYKKKGIINQYVSISLYNTYLSGFNDRGLIILFKSEKKSLEVMKKLM